MGMKPLRLITLAVLAALVGLGSSIGSFGEGTLAQGCTVTLSPGSSIQEAINRAAKGDVICLKAGEWKENLIVEKSLTLRAAEVKPQPDVVIRSVKKDWPVILIRSEEAIEVAVIGLKVTGAFGWCYDWPICPNGISVHGRAQATIQNNTISDNVAGIVMRDSSQATIENTTISVNRWDGIVMWDSSQATIQNTTISGNWRGIVMWDSSQASIQNSTISDNYSGGIVMWGSAKATIENNKIVNNEEYGVTCYQRPCFDTDYKFEGAVRGQNNELSGNTKADVCPEELKFLMTPTGGCYGPKC